MTVSTFQKINLKLQILSVFLTAKNNTVEFQSLQKVSTITINSSFIRVMGQRGVMRLRKQPTLEVWLKPIRIQITSGNLRGAFRNIEVQLIQIRTQATWQTRNRLNRRESKFDSPVKVPKVLKEEPLRIC